MIYKPEMKGLRFQFYLYNQYVFDMLAIWFT